MDTGGISSVEESQHEHSLPAAASEGYKGQVVGTDNPADLRTKPLPRTEIDGHLRRLGLSRATGRTATAPHADAGVDTTLADAAKSW